MSGLGGLNKSEGGMVVGLVQYQLPAVETPEHVARTAREGGATDCLYTYMKDLVEGNYRLPWEENVKVKDGTSEGFPRRELAIESRSRKEPS